MVQYNEMNICTHHIFALKYKNAWYVRRRKIDKKPYKKMNKPCKL